jgi:ligand-binding sensor domain-containing protein
MAKFDGFNWTVYDTSNSGLPQIAVTCIAIDQSNNKWIGANVYGPWEEGIAMFDGSNWTVYDTSNSGLPWNEVECLTIDQSNNKWIGTWRGGMAKYDGSNWTVYDTSNSGLPHNRVTCIAIDQSNDRWVGTYDGMAKFDGSNWTVYDTSNSGLPHNRVTCIAIDQSNNKWIGTYGGMAMFDGSNWIVYNESNSGLPHNRITCISIDEGNNKWIGSWASNSGLAVFNEGGIVSIEDNKTTSKIIIPNNYMLIQNFPNPFNPTTKIKYELPITNYVDLSIYNLLGQKVATLISQKQEAGPHYIEWDASRFASGVYYYRIEAGNFVQTRKMIYLK